MSEEKKARPLWMDKLLREPDASQRQAVRAVMDHVAAESDWSQIDEDGEADITVPDALRGGHVTINKCYTHTDRSDELFPSHFREGCAITFWLKPDFNDPAGRPPQEAIRDLRRALIDLYGLEGKDIATRIFYPPEAFRKHAGTLASCAVVIGFPKGFESTLQKIDQMLMEEARINPPEAAQTVAGKLAGIGTTDHNEMLIRDMMQDCYAIEPLTIDKDGRAILRLPKEMQPLNDNKPRMMITDRRLQNTPYLRDTKGLVLWMERTFCDALKREAQPQHAKRVDKDIKERCAGFCKALAEDHDLQGVRGPLLKSFVFLPTPVRDASSESHCAVLLTVGPSHTQTLLGPIQRELKTQQQERDTEYARDESRGVPNRR